MHVATHSERDYRWALHPLHAVLLAGTIPLYLGALLCDVAYWRSYHIQWTNFASWLIVGALVFGGAVLVWALIGLLRGARHGRALAYFALILASWLAGLFDALWHARDAWAAMPGGLVLSIIATLLACAATWVGFSSWHAGGRS